MTLLKFIWLWVLNIWYIHLYSVYGNTACIDVVGNTVSPCIVIQPGEPLSIQSPSNGSVIMSWHRPGYSALSLGLLQLDVCEGVIQATGAIVIPANDNWESVTDWNVSVDASTWLQQLPGVALTGSARLVPAGSPFRAWVSITTLQDTTVHQWHGASLASASLDTSWVASGWDVPQRISATVTLEWPWTGSALYTAQLYVRQDGLLPKLSNCSIAEQMTPVRGKRLVADTRTMSWEINVAIQQGSSIAVAVVLQEGRALAVLQPAHITLEYTRVVRTVPDSTWYPSLVLSVALTAALYLAAWRCSQWALRRELAHTQLLARVPAHFSGELGIPHPDELALTAPGEQAEVPAAPASPRRTPSRTQAVRALRASIRSSAKPSARSVYTLDDVDSSEELDTWMRSTSASHRQSLTARKLLF